MDKEQAYQIIKDGLAWMKGHPKSDPSEKTKAEYITIFNRLTLEETISPIPKMESTTSRNSFTKMRVSINFVLRAKIEILLREQDKLQISGDMGAWLKKVNQLDILMHQVNDIANVSMQNVVRRRSKRLDIAGLPDDWREQLIPAVQEKDVTAALVSSVVGCRPVELVTGVEIEIGDGVMLIAIRGAKVTDNSGQPIRGALYKLPPRHSLVKHLTTRLGPGRHMVQIDNASRFSTGIRDAARRAFPKLRRTITAYCLRHQVASDIKASNLSPDDISKLLGHCVDRTRGRYGNAKYSSKNGGTAPDAVTSEREIKHVVDLNAVKQMTAERKVERGHLLPDRDSPD